MEIPVLVHTFLWSCVLKASVVEHQSIPSINTWLTLKGHLNQYLVDTWSTSQSADSQLIFVDMWIWWVTVNIWPTIDWVSIKCQSRCQLSVSLVLITYWLRCWLTVDHVESIKGFLIAFEIPLPLGYEFFLEPYHLTFEILYSCLHKLISLLKNFMVLSGINWHFFALDFLKLNHPIIFLPNIREMRKPSHYMNDLLSWHTQ